MGRFTPAANFDALAQRDARADLENVAEKIAERAGDLAPVGTGRYKQSLRATVDDRGVVAETVDPAGHIVESGSVNNQPYSPLRSAAVDVAKKFEPK